jgi:hypothetical protein
MEKQYEIRSVVRNIAKYLVTNAVIEEGLTRSHHYYILLSSCLQSDNERIKIHEFIWYL